MGDEAGETVFPYMVYVQDLKDISQVNTEVNASTHIQNRGLEQHGLREAAYNGLQS